MPLFGTRRSCSFTDFNVSPGPVELLTSNDTGKIVVNHPTVLERSEPSTISSRPCPSRSKSTLPSPAHSESACANDASSTSVSRRYALYILTGTDIPFVQDGFRDGEHVREWMHERFVKELRARDKAFVIVEGDPITRLKAATEAIDRVLGLSRLYRPVGPKELDLITESGWSSFPPRLEWQPIFYPVLNFEYAARIASEWK